MLQTIRNLPRTVWLIGLISLVNDSSSEMLYPLIPLSFPLYLCTDGGPESPGHHRRHCRSHGQPAQVVFRCGLSLPGPYAREMVDAGLG